MPPTQLCFDELEFAFEPHRRRRGKGSLFGEDGVKEEQAGRRMA